MASTAPREDIVMEDEEQRPPLTRSLLHRSATNNISQVAMVGSKACPIESLDYEYAPRPSLPPISAAIPCLAFFNPSSARRLIENDVFKQDWRARGRTHILRYLALKWALCFLVGALTAAAAFLANLGVENVAGVKFVVTSTLMLERR